MGYAQTLSREQIFVLQLQTTFLFGKLKFGSQWLGMAVAFPLYYGVL